MTVGDARELVNQDDWPWQIVEERVPLPAAPAGTAPAAPPGIQSPLPPVHPHAEFVFRLLVKIE